MHIVALADKVKMNPGFLREPFSVGVGSVLKRYAVRIMRCLAAHNIFLEMGAGSQWFANNRVSLRLDSKEPLSKVLGDPP